MELHENVEMEHNAAISTWGHDGWYMVFVGSLNLVGTCPARWPLHYTVETMGEAENKGEIL